MKCLINRNMLCPIITLLSDFGLKDSYVAEMKAAILSLSREVQIIDISHQVEKFDVRTGAFLLACAAPHFPEDTIHVAVVDPGVGTVRLPIIIQTLNACYVGPDNGVLALAVRNDGGPRSVHKINDRKLMLPNVSSTFHGRDVFAPAAARLANGRRPAEFGPKISKIDAPTFAQVIQKQGTLVGEVIHIDDFGNIITNFRPKDIRLVKTEPVFKARIKNTELTLKLCKTYAEVSQHEPLALMGSHSFLEISMNQGNAAESLKTKEGDKIAIRLT